MYLYMKLSYIKITETASFRGTNVRREDISYIVK